MTLPTVDYFEKLVIEDIPLIDTRAPVEYEKGAFKNSINLPLLTDKERELIGTTYKQKGNEAALRLGYELVSGEIKEKRVNSWVSFIKKHPNTHIYCWRGGQRSEIVQKWIYEASGIVVPRLKGGYKAFRNYLIDRSIELAKAKDIVVIGGRTGSNKTGLVNSIPCAIDLEGIAKHRGSAFGRYAKEQPTQINFENNLAYAQIKHNHLGFEHLIIEDESRNIGRCFIPLDIFKEFVESKLIVLEVDIQTRVENIYNDYILYSYKEYEKAYFKGLTPFNWHDTMMHNFKRIQKRLGYERYQKYLQMFEDAWQIQLESGDASKHKEWIEKLLIEYYDPMYDYQIKSKEQRVLFRGNKDEVLEFIAKEYKCLQA